MSNKKQKRLPLVEDVAQGTSEIKKILKAEIWFIDRVNNEHNSFLNVPNKPEHYARGKQNLKGPKKMYSIHSII